MAILACGFRAFQGLRLWFLGCCLGFVEKLQPIVFIDFFRLFHGAEQQPKPSSPPLSPSYSLPQRPVNPHTVKAPCSHPSAARWRPCGWRLQRGARAILAVKSSGIGRICMFTAKIHEYGQKAGRIRAALGTVRSAEPAGTIGVAASGVRRTLRAAPPTFRLKIASASNAGSASLPIRRPPSPIPSSRAR